MCRAVCEMSIVGQKKVGTNEHECGIWTEIRNKTE